MKAGLLLSLLVSVIAFGFVYISSRPKAREAFQSSDTQQPTSHQIEPPERLRHHLWKAIKWAAATGVAVFGLLQGVDQYWGRPWPTEPEVHAHDVVSTSSLILPFTVKNKSYFDMTDVELLCGVDLVLFEDAHKHVGAIENGVFSSGLFSIASGKPINYPCDASNLFEIQNGALVLRRSIPPLRTKPGLFEPPITILKMCIWVGTNWRFAGMNWTFNSNIFKWPASKELPQWVEGPIARQVPYKNRVKDAWSTPDEIECSSTVGGTYMLFKEGQPAKKVEDISKR